MARVVLENLVKTYPGKSEPGVRAVDGVSLEIGDGEFMVLVGPSGCGKSTTLRMIAGLEEISGGTVSIDGRVVNDVLPKDRDIAMVFQNYALYPHMSVYDNMAFGLRMRGRPRAEIDVRVREAAAMLGLGECLGRKPKALSGGQRQRVALGRAIVRQPKVFLFDEPLSNLDARMRADMRVEISRLHRSLGATMIYVTHDQVEAMTMGDRICVMKDGAVRQADEPLAVYRRPADTFVAGFIGSPPMNFIPGSVRNGPRGLVFSPAAGDGGGASVAALSLPAADTEVRPPVADGGAVILGIRPEDISECGSGPSSSGRGIAAVVEAAEPMGAETHLHLKAAGQAIVARVRSERRHEPGQAVTVDFDLSKAHLFDAATGRRL
jgi:multiple sugar transport system ATP-binding protein